MKINYYTKNSFISYIVLTSILFFTASCNHTRPNTDVNFTTIDFAPVNGGWNINRQSGNLTFNAVKFYRVTVNLDRPAPTAFSWPFSIHDDEFWSDPWLGTFMVTFNAGSRSGTINYRANAGANRTPPGAVDLNDNRLWLGCTGGKGLVRGNTGKEGNGHADAYITRNTQLVPAGTTVRAGGTVNSPKHSISCI